MKKIIWIATIAAALTFNTNASVIITLSQDADGTDVFATAAGSLDLTGLTKLLDNTTVAQMNTQYGVVITGPSGPTDMYRGAVSSTGTSIGSNSAWFIGTGSGDTVGISYQGGSSFFGDVYLPDNYVSGTSLSGTAEFLGESYASLGLTGGSNYTYTWGAGESLTIDVLEVVPEPSTILLAGVSASAFLFIRRFFLV